MKADRCPAPHCAAFDVVEKDVYAQQGGAHLAQVVFERPMPEYDGLIYEHPVEAQMPTDAKGPVAFRPEPILRRMPGTLYYMVLLDSNAFIYAKAKSDFDFVVQSIVVE